MSISPMVQEYLEGAHINYDLVHHGFSESSYDAACSSHVPIASVIKSIVLRDSHNHHYLLAMIPACNKLKLQWVNEILGRSLVLAREDELQALMPDCSLGAIPPLGQIYGMDVIWDSALREPKQLYFEGGDHEDLVHITHGDFLALFNRRTEGNISVPADNYSLFHADELRGSRY